MEEKCYIEKSETALLDYFSGTLSPAQREEVEKWMEQSDENKKIAQDIQYLYRATDTLKDIKSIDVTSALLQVKKKIGRHAHRSFLFWTQRVAAILMLPLLISTLYLAFKEQPVEYVEIKTNPGMTASVNLPDGTRVWLNSKSYLKHPIRFTGDFREVELNGEAYFSVHKDKNKRFIVYTPFDIKAEVLGTEFNMEAYKTDHHIKTTLISGSVKLSYLADNNEKKSFLMKPNEEFVYNANTKSIQISNPYIPTQTAWKDGMVIFRNTSFEEALKILGKQFNAEFIVKNSKLYNNSFTGPFDGQHLQLILEHFRLSSGIQYRFIDPEVGKDKQIKEKTIVELY